MKKNQIKGVLNGLKQVKMPKLADKDLRNELIKTHIQLLGQAKKFDSELEDVRAAILGPYDDDIRTVQELQAKMAKEQDPQERKKINDEIESKTELLDAINAFNKAIEEKGNEEIEVQPIDGEKFAMEYAEGQDYDAAVVEAIFPLFK